MAPQGPDSVGSNFQDQRGVLGKPGTDLVTIAYTNSQKIWIAAYNSRCQPGSGVLGDGCALTVNKVLQTALGHTIPDPTASNDTCGGKAWNPVTSHQCSTAWVPDVVQALLAQNFGYEVSQSNAVQGDIAVQYGTDPINGMNHIGICENNGCTVVLSNAGSIGELCGETNAAMSNNGYNYDATKTPTFYHIS